jgi:NhaP-type Na+/H+ or K+/H+ antiporter
VTIFWLVLSRETLLRGSTSRPRQISKLTGDSDWFRKETKDDSLQPTIDMLLNVSFFLWIGAVCPWNLFGNNSVIPVYRLIALGIMILLFRRLPFVLLVHRQIYQIEEIRHALFVGYFGPIGVSAIFYLYIALDWLEDNVKVGNDENPEVQRLSEALTVVVWFLVICSIVSGTITELRR